MFTFKTRGKMGLWRSVTVMSGGHVIKADTEGRCAHWQHASTRQAMESVAEELMGYARLAPKRRTQ